MSNGTSGPTKKPPSPRGPGRRQPEERDVGIGGSVTDDAQLRLGRKMASLTGGDLSRPIVAVGWNSERFDGRNLALRLVALGYSEVRWYRGGREAW